MERNSFTGPSYQGVNVSLTKGFNIPSERIIGDHASPRVPRGRLQSVQLPGSYRPNHQHYFHYVRPERRRTWLTHGRIAIPLLVLRQLTQSAPRTTGASNNTQFIFLQGAFVDDTQIISYRRCSLSQQLRGAHVRCGRRRRCLAGSDFTIDPARPLATMPADFTGLSYESAQLGHPEFFSEEQYAADCA